MGLAHAALASVGLAACYGPHPATGAPCDPLIDNCPSGQMCIAQGGDYHCLEQGQQQPVDGATSDDGPVVTIDAAPDDVDGDGVKNAADNCPTKANATQSNEDGDALGDVCDPCPPYTNNADGDGDGVGDLCDPNPTTAGDQIALFEGFSDGIPPSWVNVGNWTASNGSAAIISADGMVSYLGPPMPPTAHGTSSLAFVPDQLFGTAGKAFGVSNPSESGATAGLVCELLHASAPAAGIANLATGSPVAQMAMTWALGDSMSAVFSRTDATFGCLVSDTTSSSSVTEPYTMTLTLTQPMILIRSKSVSGQARWLMYVTSP